MTNKYLLISTSDLVTHINDESMQLSQQKVLRQLMCKQFPSTVVFLNPAPLQTLRRLFCNAVVRWEFREEKLSFLLQTGLQAYSNKSKNGNWIRNTTQSVTVDQGKLNKDRRKEIFVM